MKILTSIAVSQAVEATRNVPSPEKTDNLCFHISVCSLKEEEKQGNENWPFESGGVLTTVHYISKCLYRRDQKLSNKDLIFKGNSRTNEMGLQEFKVSLVYIVSSRQPRLHNRETLYI